MFTEADTIDTLNPEQLQEISRSDNRYLLGFLERNSVFDVPRVRLMLEMAVAAASARVAAAPQPAGEALTDEQIDALYINGKQHWIGKRAIVRAVEREVRAADAARIAALQADLQHERETIDMQQRSIGAAMLKQAELERERDQARGEVEQLRVLLDDAVEAAGLIQDHFGTREQCDTATGYLWDRCEAIRRAGAEGATALAAAARASA